MLSLWLFALAAVARRGSGQNAPKSDPGLVRYYSQCVTLGARVGEDSGERCEQRSS